ncbi:cytosine permease [Sporolactobacillus nakayamae]|uniref:Putative hydroxymethylpyrimidine transporter CytX n=1 Tax=Sporolactobacillus nakayamae TaxID=269670 RepID=A0A1I2S2G0_9BACL|nr:cytosine permease [Sporolactobacillus nakayamae]SFG46940.1 putative hydroxymethylpyrimidine transporter CytX [Sporolactobacillus nakayamae]
MSDKKIIEYSALDPVPKNRRTMNFFDMLATWTGANANNGTWYVGGVVGAAGFGGALIVTLVSNPIAYLLMAIIGFMGYKIGTSTMSLVRPSLGIRGSYILSIFNALQYIGWTAINTFLAAISISFILSELIQAPPYGASGGNKTMLIGIVIMTILHFLSIMMGHKSVKFVERIGMVLILILGVWEMVAVLSQVSLEQIIHWQPKETSHMPIGTAMDTMAAFSLGWIPVIADFTRYTKRKVDATIAPLVGANIGLFWFVFVGLVSTIGTALSTGVYDPNNSDPSTIASKLGLGVIAFLIIIFTSTTANAIDLMGAGISITNLNKKFKSIPALFISTILAGILTVVPLYFGNFLGAFETLLNYINMVFGPIFGIMIVDFFLLKKIDYCVEELDKKGGKYWYFHGFNLASVFSWGICIGFYLIGNRIGLFSSTIGVTFPTIALSAILYYVISKCVNKFSSNTKQEGMSLENK